MTGIEQGPTPPDSGGRILARYRVRGDIDEAARIGRWIAFEQTVELPEALVDPLVRRAVVGRVEAVHALPVDARGPASDVVVSYEAELANDQLPQLLNLVLGNVSLRPDVRLVGLELPPRTLEAFAGPRFGVDGLRALAGVRDRPLLATAIKPRGLSLERLAGIAHEFALGGGDLVKDDQNLVDDFESFKRRVDACAGAVERAADATGRACLYFPHVAAPFEELPRRLDYVWARGLRGVLLSPAILGLDTVRGLAARYPLAVMAHPAFGGGHLLGPHSGMAHELLLGTLFRVAGADISVFPAPGGRFTFSRARCLAIASALRAPLGRLAPALPCPAGGMQLEGVPGLVEDYGRDAVLLVGGALLGHPGGVRAGTEAFLDAIRAAAGVQGEGRVPPKPPPSRAARAGALPSPGPRRLAHGPGWQWDARPGSPYKDAGDLSFRGVRRVELVGRFGEGTGSDLRYFEVEPGGYTSHEKHVHTHIIIGARGEGRLTVEGEESVIRPFDVAHIGPLEAHQLRNEGEEPFGFFCVVDHERDRPMKP